MKLMKLNPLGILLLTMFLLSYGCRALDVMIEAEEFTGAGGAAEVKAITEGEQAVQATGETKWLAFDVDVVTAGRYRCEVRLASTKPASCWMEDHCDDSDTRPCNVTGPVAIPASAGPQDFVTVVKDGSPLNAGPHKMRLHLDGDAISVDWIKFTLMKEHQETPTILTQSTTGDTWALVWSDEFDGEGVPDTDKWTFDIGNWGWGNNEPQYYTELRPDNARQENGNLVIEARRNDMGHEWTSARLTTRGKVSFVYGKIEFRAKVPAGDGAWAAGWLLGDAYRDELSWPYCGEIDVLECVGREIDETSGDGINHASCHTRAYFFKQGNHITSTIPVKNMSGEFHTYTIEWSPRGIHAFLDGKKYYTYDKLDGEWEWPFNRPQNLIINLAMGGGMGGPIDSSLTSQKVIVDYIRVYERR